MCCVPRGWDEGLNSLLGQCQRAQPSTAVSTWPTGDETLHVPSPDRDLVLSSMVLSGRSQEHDRDRDNIEQ